MPDRFVAEMTLSAFLKELSRSLRNFCAHEPRVDTRVPGERSCVRVVGGDEAAHRVLCIEGNFQPDCPLAGEDGVVRVIDEWYDTCCGFEFDVHVEPLEVIEAVEVVLERAVGRHRGGLVKGDVTGIDGEVLLLVDVVHDFLCTGLEVSPVRSLVGVELEVRGVQDLFAAEVVLRLDAFCEFKVSIVVCVVAGVAEVILVDVHRVREAEVFVCRHQAFDDLCRGDLEVRDRVMDGETVQSPCPGFRAAGIDAFDAISLGLAQDPCDIGSGVLDLLVLEVLEDKPVVAEDRECCFIDDGGVVDLLVDMAGVERGHCRFHGKREPHAGVLVAGFKDGRDGLAALDPGDAGGLVGVEMLVFGTVPAAGVDLGACNMGMDLKGTCHDGLVLGIDDFCTGPDLVDNLAVLDGNILLVALDSLDRVKDVAVLDDIFRHLRASLGQEFVNTLVDLGQEFLIREHTLRRVDDLTGLDRDVVHTIGASADFDTDHGDRDVDIRDLGRAVDMRVDRDGRFL